MNAPEGNRPDLTPSLVARLRAGDTDAGTLLNELCRGPMLRFCWGYLGNVQDAEDAVQELFYRVLRAAETPDDFRAWLYKLARNHCRNVLRQRARQDADALPSESRMAAEQTGNLSRLVRQELRSRVGHLVAALPEGQREALRLRYVEGLSRAEMAYVLELPEAVVKSRLFEGVKKLREHTSLLSG